VAELVTGASAEAAQVEALREAGLPVVVA
jgi:hypothetical protein